MDAWKDYILWCRKFNRLRKTSDRRTALAYLMKLKRYCADHHEVRGYRKKAKAGLLHQTFKQLFYNMQINRFFLRNRLKLGSELSLFERTIVVKIFSLWKKNRLIGRMLGHMNQLVQRGHIKHALKTWYEFTWGPVVPPVPIRQRLALAGSKVMNLLAEIRSRGKEFLQRKREELRESMTGVLKRTPVIGGMLQSSRDELTQKMELKVALRQQRMEVIRQLNIKSGMNP
jgi:hypothetical protein